MACCVLLLESLLLDSVLQSQMIDKEQRASLHPALERGILPEGSRKSMTPTWKCAVCVTGH